MAKDEMLIIIVDDDEVVAETLQEMVEAISPEIKALVFHGPDVLKEKRIFDAALFIIDIHLKDMDGRELAIQMPKICRSAPFLFISGYPLEDSQVIESGNFLTVDFIAKPFSFAILKNRVKILLSVSGECRRVMFGYDLEKKDIEHYSFLPFVAVVLDENLKIHYANKQLRRLIGAPVDQKLYALDWLSFIPEPNHLTVEKIHRHVFKTLDMADSEYVESTYEVMTSKGKQRTMIWGNTIFQGGPDEEKLILSIATLEAELSPLMRKKRKYWENQIYLHRAAIKDMRRKFIAERKATGGVEICRLDD